MKCPNRHCDLPADFPHRHSRSNRAKSPKDLSRALWRELAEWKRQQYIAQLKAEGLGRKSIHEPRPQVVDVSQHDMSDVTRDSTIDETLRQSKDK